MVAVEGLGEEVDDPLLGVGVVGGDGGQGVAPYGGLLGEPAVELLGLGGDVVYSSPLTERQKTGTIWWWIWRN